MSILDLIISRISNGQWHKVHMTSGILAANIPCK